MKIQTKEIYKCDFCNKLYQVRGRAEAHEAICFKNPENYRPCFRCSNLEKKETIYDQYYSGMAYPVKVNIFHCKAKCVFLYTPQNEIKGNQFDMSDNEPMPKQCDLQSSEFELPF